MWKVILLSKQNQSFQPADHPWRWKRMAKPQNWVSWPHYCLMWSLIVTVNWSDLESARRHTFKASRCVLEGERSKKSHCEGRWCHLMSQNPGVNKRKNKKGEGRGWDEQWHHLQLFSHLGTMFQLPEAPVAMPSSPERTVSLQSESQNTPCP